MDFYDYELTQLINSNDILCKFQKVVELSEEQNGKDNKAILLLLKQTDEIPNGFNITATLSIQHTVPDFFLHNVAAEVPREIQSQLFNLQYIPIQVAKRGK